MRAPESRLRALNQRSVSAKGKFVLYWMTSARRPHYNFGLEHAVALAKQHHVPLLVLEALRVGYPWASVRLHDFVLAGMRDHLAHFEGSAVTYYPYVEPSPGAGSGLLAALAEHACSVVADDYPAFFLPHMLEAAARKISVCMEAVDGNGLLPISAADGRTFATAYSFRRFLQQKLPAELSRVPRKDPLKGVQLAELTKLPRGIAARWPAVSEAELADRTGLLARLPIDQSVPVVTAYEGGYVAGAKQLKRFLGQQLAHYADARSHPDSGASSGLSPWLHFGHVSTHQVIAELMKVEDWDGHPRGKTRNGTREGFWGLSAGADAFLDELVTWRELGFNTCATLENYADYDSLPDWARETLREHEKDPREPLYTLAQLERAETYDEIWNAAQRQLLWEGRIHNYLRMLWGKKILEWTRHPREALEIMIQLNNKYAVDGRDPNSYSGIFWVLGRYDRPWAPKRKIFGSIRYMSSASTQRKLRLRRYLEHYGSAAQGELF
ncbi:MAG: deoxyribodipyrimidine photolyase [Myxococcales bacterium]